MLKITVFLGNIKIMKIHSIICLVQYVVINNSNSSKNLRKTN